MGFETEKRVGGGGSAGGAQHGQSSAVGKGTLSAEHDEPYHELPNRSVDAPTESGGGGTLTSPRFADDAQLAAVADGTKTLKKGASGVHVRKVQRALAECGLLAHDKVSGTIDAETETALKLFQKHKTIPDSGVIDQATIQALNAAFSDYSIEGAVLQGIKPSSMPTQGKPYDVGKAPKELTDGTHALSNAERDAFNEAISTETKAVGGVLPTFKETVGGKKYGDRIAAEVTKQVDAYLVRAKDAEKDRNAGHLYDWKDVEQVAVESKKATDATFGKYASGNALKATGVDAKIKDAWKQKEDTFKADPAEEDEAANWRVEKIITGSSRISKIDTEHGAVQSRAAEKAILKKIREQIATARKADLVLIHKWWPAFASGGEVFVQRIQNHDASGKFDKAEGRNYMWDMFQTVIHEYIHTLEHPEHEKYRKTLPAQKGGFTLREGTTDYFTKIAYNNTNKSNATLRQNVEGPFHEKGKTHPVPDLHTYRESQNAERAAGVVGLQNMCAGFFLGRVDLIGKK
jgi:hypothetical protein